MADLENDVSIIPRPPSRCSVAKSYLICLSVVILSLVILLGLLIANAILEDPWNDGITNFGRCEQVKPDKLLRERANTLSNLGFVYIGFYVLAALFWDIRYGRYSNSADSTFQHLGFYPINVFVWGASLVIEGYGSFHYHASGSSDDMGGYMDILGIFLLCVATFQCVILALINSLMLLVPNFNKRMYKRTVFLDVTLLIVFCALLPTMIDFPEIVEELGYDKLKVFLMGVVGSIAVFTMFVIIITKCKKLSSYTWTFIPFSVISIGIAVVLWYPEEIKGECLQGRAPQENGSIFQAHAFWHVGISISLGGLYCFLRTIDNPFTQKMGILSFCLLRIPDNANGISTESSNNNESNLKNGNSELSTESPEKENVFTRETSEM